MKYYILIIFLFLFTVKSHGQRVPDSLKDQLLAHATPELKSFCDSRLVKFRNNPDSAERAYPWDLRVRSTQYIELSGKSYIATLLGCTGLGELVILDSANTNSKPRRIQMNFPMHYVAIKELHDVNNDNVPELEIYLHSGSHMAYLTLVSIYEDSLSFILDDKGYYQFGAPGGGTRIEDLDNDGIMEIILEDMIWPGEEDPPEARYFIHKWDGEKYVFSHQEEIRK
ncbi:MAG: hypothetical protein IIC66_12040 [candidate division Zixibacteria bacterium]|nr:hypothetical protein [candidate division Zixibacteria bacterium]